MAIFYTEILTRKVDLRSFFFMSEKTMKINQFKTKFQYRMYLTFFTLLYEKTGDLALIFPHRVEKILIN